MQILGAEVCSSKVPEDLARGAMAHILAIRNTHVALKDATAVVIIESNLPLIAEAVRRVVESTHGIGRTVIMTEDRKKHRGGGGMDAVARAGTRTSRTNKPEMVAALSTALQMRAVRFATPFVVARPDQQPMGEPHPRECVITELSDFKQEIKVPKGKNAAYKTIERAYSGRHAGNSRARDDYCMALCFIMLLYDVFRQSRQYAAYR